MLHKIHQAGGRQTGLPLAERGFSPTPSTTTTRSLPHAPNCACSVDIIKNISSLHSLEL